EPLLGRLCRTLALELNVARLEGQLQGDTPEERFQNFLAELRRPERLRAVLQEYPVLARHLVLFLDRWVACSLEFLHHLCADAPALRALFSPNRELGVLEAVEGGGDTHRGGRAVRMVRFSSGLRLAYKPRSLAVEVHFQQLLLWLNRHGKHAPFQILAIL